MWAVMVFVAHSKGTSGGSAGRLKGERLQPTAKQGMASRSDGGHAGLSFHQHLATQTTKPSQIPLKDDEEPYVPMGDHRSHLHQQQRQMTDNRLTKMGGKFRLTQKKSTLSLTFYVAAQQAGCLRNYRVFHPSIYFSLLPFLSLSPVRPRHCGAVTDSVPAIAPAKQISRENCSAYGKILRQTPYANDEPKLDNSKTLLVLPVGDIMTFTLPYESWHYN